MTLPPEGMNVEQFVLAASREEVEAADPSRAIAGLCELLPTEPCRRFRRKLIFVINGYDDDPRDLWEFPEVCRWMKQVDEQWPFWFYFMYLGKLSSLSMVTFCLCPWVKVAGGKQVEHEHLVPFVRERMTMMLGIGSRIDDDRFQNLRMVTDILEFYNLSSEDVFPDTDTVR